MTSHIQFALTIIRRKQVEARTGLSRSSIYARLRQNPKRPGDYDPTFPKPISVGRSPTSGRMTVALNTTCSRPS